MAAGRRLGASMRHEKLLASPLSAQRFRQRPISRGICLLRRRGDAAYPHDGRV